MYEGLQLTNSPEESGKALRLRLGETVDIRDSEHLRHLPIAVFGVVAESSLLSSVTFGVTICPKETALWRMTTEPGVIITFCINW